MKKILIMLFVGGFSQCFGQFVVSDPGTQFQLIQVVGTSVEIVNQARKTVSALEKARSFIEKVNASIRQLELLERIIEEQKTAIERASYSIQQAKSSGQFSKHEIDVMTYNFTILIDATNQTLSLAESILKEGFFRMSDAERIKMLSDLEREVTSARYDIDRLYSIYQLVASKRIMYDVFGEK